MKTCSITPANIKKDWVTVDCANRPLGRVATEIATILRGKHKASFVPHLDCGNNVIALNASKISLSGNKWDQKTYYHHSGYIGGIKSINAKDLLAKKPEMLITNAVKGMLPKNKLGRKVMKNLRVCLDQEHGHEAQKPQPAKPRLVTGE